MWKNTRTDDVVYRHGTMRFEFGGLYLTRLDPKLTYNCPLFHDNRLMPYSGEDKSSGRDYERCRQRCCIYTFAADDSSRFETSKRFSNSPARIDVSSSLFTRGAQLENRRFRFDNGRHVS